MLTCTYHSFTVSITFIAVADVGEGFRLGVLPPPPLPPSQPKLLVGENFTKNSLSPTLILRLNELPHMYKKK